jgi:arsenate reductase (glutaredoxin)
LLNEHGVEFENREYTQAPLSQAELRSVFAKLSMSPRQLLRGRDAKKAGLSGNESDDELIALMEGNPRLLQRPILINGDKAVVGRPVENLLALL